MSESSDKLTQQQWFLLGEDHYNGMPLKECAERWEINEEDIIENLTEITGIEVRKREPFVKVSEPEYEKESLTQPNPQEYASGRAPGDSPEEPVKNPKRIIEV